MYNYCTFVPWDMGNQKTLLHKHDMIFVEIWFNVMIYLLTSIFKGLND